LAKIRKTDAKVATLPGVWPYRGRNEAEYCQQFYVEISKSSHPHDFALIMAAAALTMIKENLTSGFLRSNKPIG
jgi:hypothetical protein